MWFVLLALGAAARVCAEVAVRTGEVESRGGATVLKSFDSTPGPAKVDFGGLPERLPGKRPNPFGLPSVLFVARHQYCWDHHNTGTDFTAGDVSVQNIRLGAAIRRWDGVTVTTLLDCPGGVIRDLELSFDARKVLFAMRRSADENFAIHEMNVDGSGLVKLTDGAFADIDPMYLPDGRIVFSSNRDVKYCGCNWHMQGNLFRMNGDGTDIRQLGRNNLYESRPSLLPDGRILYDRWEYVDRHFAPSFGLWTMFPDGRAQALFYGNNAWAPGAIFDARVLPGGDPERVVCIFGACHDRPWGALVALDRRRGLDGMAPVLRSFPADITNRVCVTPNYGTGRDPYHTCASFIDTFANLPVKYEDPFPLDAKRVLCSRTVEGERTALFLANLGDGTEKMIHEERPFGCFDPIPLEPREKPPVLVDAVDDTRTTGVFYVADVYHGTGMEHVKRGTITHLRIVEAPPKRHRSPEYWNTDTTHRPAVNYNSTNIKRVLGVVPVEKDGSALFEVEAGRFIYFQALDADGRMVQSMRSGTTLQPGEIASCVGCHEDRLEVTVARQDVSTRANRRPARPVGAHAGVFSYVRDVQPIFDRQCVKCHDYGKEGGKALNLCGDLGVVFNVSYLSLRAHTPLRWYPDKPGQRKEWLKPVDDGPPEVLDAYAWGSHRSRLVDLLDAGHHGVKLSKDERARLIEWIDLNMPYYPSYQSNFPDHPFGRSPLTHAQTQRLVQLTNCRHSIAANGPGVNLAAGTGVNFTRPEMSPCLANVTGTAREQALEIIRQGAEALRRNGRPDIPGWEGREAESRLRLVRASGDAESAERGAEKMIDGDNATYASLLDDSCTGGDGASVPPRGSLPVTGEALFDLGQEREVEALDFVAPPVKGVGLPRRIDVIGADGAVIAENVHIPGGEEGRVETVRIPRVRTRYIGFRVLDSHAPTEGGRLFRWQVAEFRVRVPVFTGHWIIGGRGYGDAREYQCRMSSVRSASAKKESVLEHLTGK